MQSMRVFHDVILCRSIVKLVFHCSGKEHVNRLCLYFIIMCLLFQLRTTA